MRRDGSITPIFSANSIGKRYSLIRAVLALVSAELPPLGITLVFDLQPSLPEISVDPIQIQQVILNLVRNSMEALASHHRKARCITLTTQWQKPAGIAFTITDTGPGLAAEINATVFNTFVTTKAEGMGIGLSICKSIIAAHGATLVTRQLPDCGATFSFVLPTRPTGSEP